ncbi:MAG: hypothetical protein WCJ46_04795 [bacterium]
MNYIDIILIVLLCLSFIIGWKLRGIYIIIIPLAFILGALAGTMGYEGLAKTFSFIKNDMNRKLIAYSFLFVLGAGVVVTAGIILARLADVFALTAVDKFIGGTVCMTLLVLLLNSFYMASDKISVIKVGASKTDIKADFKASAIFPYIEGYAAFLTRLPVINYLNGIKKIIG